jgi:hypothetical protein
LWWWWCSCRQQQKKQQAVLVQVDSDELRLVQMQLRRAADLLDSDSPLVLPQVEQRFFFH